MNNKASIDLMSLVGAQVQSAVINGKTVNAIVIPVDEKGHLNASRFIDGSRTLANLQTSYAESMKEFGLMRGLENSSAKHTD